MSDSITIIVPAYNEEKHLRDAIQTADSVVKEIFNDYEILIFNDYSSDRTGEIAEGLAKENPNIKVIHNKKNMGLGYNIKKGIELAKKKYVTVVTGENDILADSFKRLLENRDKADIIIAYNTNTGIRPMYRRIISKVFSILLNILFGLRLRYYLGPSVCKTELAKKVKITTYSFAYHVEIVVGLIANGCSYKEVPVYNREPKGTSMFRIKNLLGICKTVITLFFSIYSKKFRV